MNKTLATNRRLKMTALLGLLVSALVYAAAIFNPETQPPVLLGKYALKNNDLLLGDTKAYRSWFENGAWQGDIIEYEISGINALIPGDRKTSAPVGETDNIKLLAYANTVAGDPSMNWMARATFLLKEDTVTDYWKTRKVITYDGAQDIDFLWHNLTLDQKKSLDMATILDPAGDGSLPALTDVELNAQTATDSFFSPTLNFILGDRSNERDKTGGFLRRRYNLLGDITTTAVFISPPRELLFSLNGFANFSSRMDPFSDTPCSGYSTSGLKQGCRPGRIAAPSNDGMLHIFDEEDGSEVYAYIPSIVIDKLDRLAARGAAYEHTYYFDGEVISGSAQINPDYGSCTSSVFSGCHWRTILTGGGGAGFAGLFALDVTDPSASGDKVVFEKTLDGDGDSIGHIYGQPRIAPLGAPEQPEWHIVTGNGYSTDPDHLAKLLMVSLDDGSVTAIGTEAGTRGLSSPVLLSTDNDIIAEFAFAGDLDGNVWVFDLASSVSYKVFEGDPDQPITNTPTLAEYPPLSGNYLLYFGTGSILSEIDAVDDTFEQAVYAVWIKREWLAAPATIAAVRHSDPFLTQSIVSVNDPFDTDDIIRVISNNKDTIDLDSVKGWKTVLPNCGERLVGAPFLRSGRLQFVTHNPTGLNCSDPEPNLDGDSWMMSLDFITGGDAGTVVYNLNGDSLLNDGDKVGDKPPVGLHLGKGNISQPTLARLSSGVDKLYINGIILPISLLPQPGPLLSGHIDVQTDSPSDGYGSQDYGKIATNAVSKHSEGYQVETNDGLGQGIDGHVHQYDTLHGVDYVDLFELEPRRGLASLATSPGTTPVAGKCEDQENEKRILVNGVCIEAVEGELNRAYDVLQTDGDGEPEATRQSEVKALGATDPLSEDQEFIVVLANADLSFSGTLQIGCRAWPVQEYQDKVTELIEGKDRVSAVAAMSAEGLVFTLSGIANDTTTPCPRVGETGEPISTTDMLKRGLSPDPTLRIGFGRRAILDEGVHGTRAQCVLGLHDYRDPVDYVDANVLCYAEDPLNKPAADCPDPDPRNWPNPLDRPAPEYFKDPADNLHITQIRSEEGKGFRWRNGALTVQLLDTGTFVLQEAAALPTKGNKRFGGTFAKAFDAELDKKGVPTGVILDYNVKDANESGLLYEATMFWHYSALADALRTSDPASTPCYGDPNWKSRVNIELGGLTLGEYQVLTDPLLADCADLAEGEICPVERYIALIGLIESTEDEDLLNSYLVELAKLLADNPELALYGMYRDYAPGHVPEQHLLPWDVDLDDPDSEQSSLDATPADVIDIETSDTEALGIEIKGSKVIWIDVQQ